MRKLIQAFILVLLSACVVYGAGSWSANGWSYKPQLTTQGTTDYTQFNISQDKIDAELQKLDTANKAVLGGSGYTDLSTALTTIGSDDVTLIVPAGAWVGSGVIPSNVSLLFRNGGYFTIANGATLTINGPIQAGPQQIFSWTGTGAVNISGSPTESCYLDWWGAEATSDHSGSDTTAILTKAFGSIGNHQTLKLSPGWYKFSTAFSSDVANKVYSIQGTGNKYSYGVYSDGFWADVGSGNVAFTFGSTGTSQVSKVVLKSFSISGPQSACQYGLVVYLTPCDLDINVRMGATEYGVALYGCISNDVKIQSYNTGATGQYGPAGVLKVAYDPTSHWSCQLTNIDIRCYGAISGGGYYFTKPPLYLAGYHSISAQYIAGDVINITGVIDQWDSSTGAIDIDTAYQVSINGLYCEGATGDSYIKNCNGVSFNGYSDTGRLVISNSYNTSLNNYEIGGLLILPDCEGTVVRNGTAIFSTQFEDYAGDTIFVNGPYYGYGQVFPGSIQDPNNYIYNAQFLRWQSDRPAGGWYKQASQTWTKETGTVHIWPTSAKSVVTGSGTSCVYIVDSTILNQVLGKTVTFSFWQNVPTGQTFNASVLYSSFSYTVPARANSTAYTYGDAVTYNGHTYLCVGPGTSDSSPPTFSDGENQTTVDGTVTWRSDVLILTGSSSRINNPPTTSDGVWRKTLVNMFIPRNATALQINIAQALQSDTSDSTIYIAEPALMIGRQTQTSPVANNPYEHLLSGVVKTDSDGYIPTNSSSKLYNKYSLVGDVCYNDGSVTALTSVNEWRCTTEGTNGSASVWAADPH